MTKSNKILPLFIITVFFLQFAVPASIFVHFKIYQDEIEAAFCVNIDKPEMNCHGQCHMQKQIAKVTINTKEKKKSSRTIQLQEILAIQNTVENSTSHMILRENELALVHYSNFYQSVVLTKEAPPPQV